MSLRAYIAADSPAAARKVALHIMHNIEQLLPDNPRLGASWPRKRLPTARARQHRHGIAGEEGRVGGREFDFLGLTGVGLVDSRALSSSERWRTKGTPWEAAKAEAERASA